MMRYSSRRDFLKTVGVSVPTLKALLAQSALPAIASAAETAFDSAKFTPVDLDSAFTASSSEFGPHDLARWFRGASAADGLLRTPTGRQNFRGIPFRLGPDDVSKKCWVTLSARTNSWTTTSIEVPLDREANFVCIASFCDWDTREDPKSGEDLAERVGQQLAEAVLVYDDGSEAKFPLRRRFEVNAPSLNWGHLPFNSLSHRQDAPRRLTDPLRSGMDWGWLQKAQEDNTYGQDVLPGAMFVGSVGTLWISALANPKPLQKIRTLRLRSTADDLFFLCGVTLFHGRDNPLRLERLSVYRITLPEAVTETMDRWKLDIDLGVVARTYVLAGFDHEAWLQSPAAGLGEHAPDPKGSPYLYVELAATPDATLVLTDTRTGKRYEFAVRETGDGHEVKATVGVASVQIVERERVKLRGLVVDAAAHRPTPVRLAFRSKEGRYIPPYGHRQEINDAWFEDYGADIKLMDSSFAYVGGEFEIELPVGEVLVEITKGFEYTPVRKKLQIEAGQQELKLELSRFTDLRSKGWITADTHVHFLSPTTAILEGEAEGVNLINLLAAQWGDLFTNVADLHYGSLRSRSGDTLVQVSTENRQHVLGHLSSLGVPVSPMSVGGPEESYLGDPLWNTMSGWADASHDRGGLVVAPHFPNPNGELAAEIALGKIDAVEIFQMSPAFNTLQIFDWYRYLNCGYRLPTVGGTDKMGAYMPVGANRTYAYLGDQEFNFANWAKSVRAGNTFSTTGPLLLFEVDGHKPGSEIVIGSGGAIVEVHAEARSFVPFHRVEIISNGKVVASREDKAGTRDLTLKEPIRLDGPGWLAARCSSRYGPTTSWYFAVAAHTSPVYVLVAGKELFSPETAAYMLTLIDGAQTWIENLAIRPDLERFEKIRKTFSDARERLHRKMHEHGIPH
jgi:hypothetical protein